MNELVVPPAAHWYKPSIMCCAPDGTLIYASKNDIVIITSKNTEPVEVRMIQGAHLKHIVSINLNPKWEEPHSYIVSAGEDNVIKVWDNFEKRCSNKEHKDVVVGAVFAGDDRVVSVSLLGTVNVWNINTNESKMFPHFFGPKVGITCLSSCPHAGWLLAFGLNNGMVIVTDMRRQGQILYRLRGHYNSVVGLAWCPAPVNVFPKNVRGSVSNQPQVLNPWITLLPKEDETEPPENDFLKECDSLKAKILGVGDAEEEVKKEVVKEIIESVEDDRETEVQNRSLPVIYDGDFCDCPDLEPVEDIVLLQSDNIKSYSSEEAAKEIDDKMKNLDVNEEEPRAEYLLATAGKDKSIYIWRAGTDGRMQTSFIASKTSSRRDKQTNVWIALAWITPDTILTSTGNGEILSWPLPKPLDLSKQFQMVHNEHKSVVFNIVAPPQIVSASNWRDGPKTNFWTWSQDGTLMNYCFLSNKIVNCFTTVTGLVTCFGASSALDPNRLAIGLRDGNIRVWDLSMVQTNVITMQRFSQKFTHKVSSLDWHPSKEMFLGFGTEEGRVGVIDLTSKKTTMLSHFFHHEVYKVEWGPLTDNKFALYAISEGKIVVYDVEQQTDPKELELPEKFFAYHFAWKLNHKSLLINGKDGSVFLLNDKLSVVNKIFVTEKGLNAIVWHPDSLTDDTDVSTRCKWFAAGTAKGVIIVDCHKIDDYANMIVMNGSGHLRPVLALAWCPFEGNKIVSTAADGLAHVWDVTSKVPIATFVDWHNISSSSIAWSPNNPDLIIMGNKTLKIWSIAKNPPKHDEDFLNERKKLLTSKPTKFETDKIKVEFVPKTKMVAKNSIVPAIYVSNDENIPEQINRMRGLMNGEESTNPGDPLKIFESKGQVTSLLAANFLEQKKHNNHSACEMISLWRGNIGEYIRNAINESRVTPSMIVMAPMVSTKLWQEACLCYASKLADEPNCDPLEVAMYYLSCHKIEEAIDILCTHSLYKEALALTKYRFPEGSDFINKVVEKWTSHSIQTGNFENAAYCYISIGDYKNAAVVLARRNNVDILNFALELAQKSPEHDESLIELLQFRIKELKTE